MTLKDLAPGDRERVENKLPLHIDGTADEMAWIIAARMRLLVMKLGDEA